jgi:hypothetical protein
MRLDAAGTYRAMAKHDFGSDEPLWRLSVVEDGTVFLISRQDYIESFLEPPPESHSQAGAAAVGVWTHVALSWDGATQRLYVGGLLVDSDANDELIPEGGELAIGADIDDNGQPRSPLFGALDDVRVYDRVLEQTELTAIMAEARLPLQ